MGERERMSFFITPAATEKLRQIALGFGFPITSGPGRGRGSLSTLMEAIAEGELQVTREQAAGGEIDDLMSLCASVDATVVAVVPKGELRNLLERHDLVLVAASENVKG